MLQHWLSNDAFGIILLGNPWYLFEAFADAGGKLNQLHVPANLMQPASKGFGVMLVDQRRRV